MFNEFAPCEGSNDIVGGRENVGVCVGKPEGV